MSTNLQAVNEPVRSYESGSDDRKNLQIKYDQMASEVVEIPLIIGGKGIIFTPCVWKTPKLFYFKL